MTATASNEDLKEEISAMRVKEIRQELESYGISTKSFFEKGEMVDALVDARKEGKTPVNGGVNGDATSATTSTSSTSSSSSSSTSSSTTTSSTADRKEQLEKEMEKCKKMKVGELKKELESYGVSTKSYFEKSEFVRAVAEARVDGPPKSSTGRASSGGGSRVEDEPRDPSYRDVIVTKFPEGSKAAMLGGGKLIDVRSR